MTFAERKIHFKLSDNTDKCDQCAKAFYHHSNLRIHMKRHNGIKPYQCSQCEKALFQNSLLITHLLTHMGENHINAACVKKLFHGKIILKHMITHWRETTPMQPV